MDPAAQVRVWIELHDVFEKPVQKSEFEGFRLSVLFTPSLESIHFDRVSSQ